MGSLGGSQDSYRRDVMRDGVGVGVAKRHPGLLVWVDADRQKVEGS